jgi:hypothetical protein
MVATRVSCPHIETKGTTWKTFAVADPNPGMIKSCLTKDTLHCARRWNGRSGF